MNHRLDRRTFMRTSSLAAGASALGLLPLQAADPAPARTRKVKLGLVGCGGRGSWIANLFQAARRLRISCCRGLFPGQRRKIR